MKTIENKVSFTFEGLLGGRFFCLIDRRPCTEGSKKRTWFLLYVAKLERQTRIRKHKKVFKSLLP